MKKIIKIALKILIGITVFVGFSVLSVALFMQHPRFGKTVDMDSARGRRISASVNYRQGEFQNLEPVPEVPNEKKKGRWETLYEVFFKRGHTRPMQQFEVVKTDLNRLDAQNDQIIWFGHSSYLIQLKGVKYLVDPVFEKASPVSFINTPFQGTDIYRASDMPAIDYVIISHDHWDHLDYDTVKEIMGRTRYFICPLGVGEHLEHWGVHPEQLIEMDWDEQAELGPRASITALTARHYSGRSIIRNQTLWNSYMLSVDSCHIYLSGDGGYGSHIAQIAQEYPQIDFAVMENGQYDEDWRYIHFIPRDLVQALHELQPARLLTTHHSRYALARHTWNDPLKQVYDITRRDSIPLFYPKIGEPIFLDASAWDGEVWWE